MLPDKAFKLRFIFLVKIALDLARKNIKIYFLIAGPLVVLVFYQLEISSRLVPGPACLYLLISTDLDNF